MQKSETFSKEIQTCLREDGFSYLLGLERMYDSAIRKGNIKEAELLKKRLDFSWDTLHSKNT